MKSNFLSNLPQESRNTKSKAHCTSLVSIYCFSIKLSGITLGCPRLSLNLKKYIKHQSELKVAVQQKVVKTQHTFYRK